MRARALICAVALFGLAPHAGAAEFESFASPIIYAKNGSLTANVTCYLSNAGEKTVRVKDLRIFTRAGKLLKLEANTCGPAANFDLAPGAACYVGTTKNTNGSAGCAALVKDGDALRGEVELRDDQTRVTASADLTPPPAGAIPSGYVTVASPPLFGSADQQEATCVFTNVGTNKAKIRNIRFVSSTGKTIKPKNLYDDCKVEGGVITAPAGTSCNLNAEVPAKDFQCRAETTNRADIRGAMFVLDRGAPIFNVLPLE